MKLTESEIKILTRIKTQGELVLFTPIHDSPDWPVVKGLMVKSLITRTGGQVSSGVHYFMLTPAGRQALLEAEGAN